MEDLRSRLNRKVCAGIFSKTTDSSFVEAAGYSGLDFIILDTEHGSASWETIHNHVRAANLTTMAPIVRVHGLDMHAIGAALDSGAAGVQIPNITCAEQAAEAVSAARFYPLGSRGVCRFVRAACYGESDKFSYFQESNNALLVLQVEGLEGVRNINSILSIPDFDVLFIGPYDLSQSAGCPGEVENPKVLSLISEISKAASKSDKKLGIFCDSVSALSRYRSMGISYLSYSVDVSIFCSAIKSLNQ